MKSQKFWSRSILGLKRVNFNVPHFADQVLGLLNNKVIPSTQSTLRNWDNSEAESGKSPVEVWISELRPERYAQRADTHANI